jgi:hypothetical protein
MAAGAEADQLIWVGQIGAPLMILAFELRQIDEHFLRSRFAGKRRNRFFHG